jgi:hypothetical protein
MDLNLKFIKDQSFSEKFKKFKNAIEKTQKENLWMQTHRVILSNGKVYLSETHFKEDKTTSDKKIKLNSLTNISNMSIPDIDFLLIYEEIKK